MGGGGIPRLPFPQTNSYLPFKTLLKRPLVNQASPNSILCCPCSWSNPLQVVTRK